MPTRSVSSVMAPRSWRVGIGISLAVALACHGCAHLLPALGQVVSRIDVQRVIHCARLGDAESKARCLGVAVLTPAIDVALQRAATLAEDAIDAMDRPSGSESPADRNADRRLARELDHALDDLAAAMEDAA